MLIHPARAAGGPGDQIHRDDDTGAAGPRAEPGKQEIIPARRAHAAFSAASEFRELKWPFQLSAL